MKLKKEIIAREFLIIVAIITLSAITYFASSFLVKYKTNKDSDILDIRNSKEKEIDNIINSNVHQTNITLNRLRDFDIWENAQEEISVEKVRTFFEDERLLRIDTSSQSDVDYFIIRNQVMMYKPSKNEYLILDTSNIERAIENHINYPGKFEFHAENYRSLIKIAKRESYYTIHYSNKKISSVNLHNLGFENEFQYSTYKTKNELLSPHELQSLTNAKENIKMLKIEQNDLGYDVYKTTSYVCLFLLILAYPCRLFFFVMKWSILTLKNSNKNEN